MTRPIPTREKVLAGLHRMREDVGPEPRGGAEQARDKADLDAAIDYLNALTVQIQSQAAHDIVKDELELIDIDRKTVEYQPVTDLMAALRASLAAKGNT